MRRVMICWKEYRRALLAVIEKLPPQQRMVYELRCVYNYKNEQVARMMELSPKTVKQHWKRVKEKIEEGGVGFWFINNIRGATAPFPILRKVKAYR